MITHKVTIRTVTIMMGRVGWAIKGTFKDTYSSSQYKQDTNTSKRFVQHARVVLSCMCSLDDGYIRLLN